MLRGRESVRVRRSKDLEATTSQTNDLGTPASFLSRARVCEVCGVSTHTLWKQS